MDTIKRIVLAITGASGACYGMRLLELLVQEPIHIYLVISAPGRLIMKHELGLDPGEPGNTVALLSHVEKMGIKRHHQAEIHYMDNASFFERPASGSFRHNGMVVAPCSMKTLSAIASGFADDLISRSADVCLKERRTLILLPRETPLNRIHLNNMEKAMDAGAVIMPPCPSFYCKPKSLTDLVDSVVARVLDHLHIEQAVMKEWGSEEEKRV